MDNGATFRSELIDDQLCERWDVQRYFKFENDQVERGLLNETMQQSRE